MVKVKRLPTVDLLPILDWALPISWDKLYNKLSNMVGYSANKNLLVSHQNQPLNPAPNPPYWIDTAKIVN